MRFRTGLVNIPELVRRMSRLGLAVGALWLLASFTPSLLPRPWWLQGLIAALSGVGGYVVGWLLSIPAHALARWLGLTVTVDPRRSRLLYRLGLGAVVALVLTLPFASVGSQRALTRYVGQPDPPWWYAPGAAVVALVVFVAFLALWRVVEQMLRFFLTRVGSRFVRELTARATASALTLGVIVLVLNLVVSPVVTRVVHANADAVNRTQPEGREAPTSPLRSGGPGSPHTWESLGQDGMTFVSSGRTAAQISAVTGRPAKEPIRVFVGNGPGIEAATAAVLAELDRTGAWTRRAIVLETPTSTGYINRWGASAVEHLLDGDCATAGFAYSDLPSAWGLIYAREDPPTAARTLLRAVRARLDAMPAGTRPRLYATGESLGAYGGEGAYSSPEEMLRLVDGAVWSGTPLFASNRRTLTIGRAPGSTSIVPVIDAGRNIRFAGTPGQLAHDEYDRPLGPWGTPRVAYLQHASDPIVWWSPSLILSSPQWLRETRSNTSMAQMTWTPLVTFWQVSADMLVSNEVPGGFGHRYYGTDMVPAWAAVLRDTRSPAQLDAIADSVGR